MRRYRTFAKRRSGHRLRPSADLYDRVLAFGETLVIIAFNLDYIGGANGFVGIPLETTLDNVYLLLAVVVFAAWRFDRSRLGYAARACRDNAHAAAAMGINAPWVKTLVFAVGSGVAGLDGGLRAHYVLVQNPVDMGFFFRSTT